jgi:hypothetical protein
MCKIRITELKRMANPDLIAEYAGDKVRDAAWSGPSILQTYIPKSDN